MGMPRYNARTNKYREEKFETGKEKEQRENESVEHL